MSRPTTIVSTDMSVNVRQDLDKLRECLGSTGLIGSEIDGSESPDNSSACSSEDLQIYEENSRSQLESHTRTSSFINEHSVLTSDTNTTHRPEEYMKHHSLEAALVTNEMYQEALGDAVARLQLALLNNQEKQASVQSDLDTLASQFRHNTKCKGIPVQFKRWQVLSTPYFKDFDGFPCPENADAITKRISNEVSPYLKNPHNWTDNEKNLLSRAVKSNVKKNVMQPFMQRLEILNCKLKADEITYEEKIAINRKIDEVKEELVQKAKLTDNQLLKISERDIDWMKISISEFDGDISPENCELMWCNFLHPFIYKGSWTEEEDKRLIECARKHGQRDWDTIALELGSKRTAEQCIKRFNEHLNPEIKQKGQWTEHENNILKNAVQHCCVGDVINWDKVSCYLESRHPVAIRQHWQSSSQPAIKKGAWLLEEDVVLLAGVKKYGFAFNKICRLLPGRTYNQCRERYACSLNLNVNFDKWTEEEDKKLICLAKEHGTKWSLISNFLEGRTPNMVLKRHNRILASIPDAYDQIEFPDSEWPNTISQRNVAAMNRRRQVYALLKKRSQALNKAKPGKTPRKHQTSYKVPINDSNSIENLENRTKLNEEFKEVLQAPGHVEFVLEEAKNLLTVGTKVSNVGKHWHQANPAMNLVDNALDSLLSSTLVCRSVGSKKQQTALGGKQSLELEHARKALYNALNVDIPDNSFMNVNPEDSDVEIADNICENKSVLESNGFHPMQSTEDVDSSAMGVKHFSNNQDERNKTRKKVNSHEVREKLFTRTILDTLTRQCFGHIPTPGDEARLKHFCVLPPMRPTVQAFKLLVLDRPRLAEVAAQTVDISLIRQIILTSANEVPKCTQCQSSEKSSIQSQTEQQNANNLTQNATSDISTNTVCDNCSRLQKIHLKYVTFKNTFLAMFFWPGLMSGVLPPTASIDPSQPYIIPPAAQIPRMKRKKIYNKRTASSVSLNLKNVAEPEFEPPPKKKSRRKKLNEGPTRSSARQKSKKGSN